MNPKKKPYRSEKYLAHVRELPCVVCGRMPVEAHHVRGYGNAGMGVKPDDVWCIPLCHQHHREYHHMGIYSFQKRYELNLWKELFLTLKDWVLKGE